MTQVAHAAEVRVAGHLLDSAAMASEHGDAMLAEILTCEARALQDGSTGALAALVQHTMEMAEVCSTVDTLRTARARADVARAALIAARAKAVDIIGSAWLREGYAAPA